MEEEPENGKKRRRRKAKKDEDLDEDILPETGLKTPDGFLFYHTQPIPLTREQKQRVKDHGINLSAERTFTLEESVLIFKNWKEFAEEHTMKLTKAPEYLSAKKFDRLLRLHQTDNHFWPKLCSGLPHRTCESVKVRACLMMTDAFLKDLNWDDPAPQIAEKYYNLTKSHDPMVWAKMKKLRDRGYASSHVAEILDISYNRAKGIATRLTRLEGRNDPAMIQKVFETACSCGLDVDYLQRLLSSGDEEKFYRKCFKRVNFEGLTLKIHLSEEQCKQFLKEKILKKMWKKYRELVEKEEKNEEEAMEEVLKIVSPKEALTNKQKLKMMEIFCQNVGKYDSLADIRENEKIAKILRENGITGFQCHEKEYEKLCEVLYSCVMRIEPLFDSLRRDFRYQVKMHCALWGWKKNSVWMMLPVKKDESRYEVVLRHELSNPFVSEMTERFLKNEQVAMWITEPTRKVQPDEKEHRLPATLLGYLAMEAFILYAHRKFKGEFKFPTKLRHLLSPYLPESIQSILNLEDENSEFLSRKEVKKTVETASEVKIGVKLKKKAFFVKKPMEEDSESEDVDDELVEKVKEKEKEMLEEMRREIDETVERADPMKRKRKFRLMDEEGNEEQIVLQKELRAQKRVLDNAIRKKTHKHSRPFTSKEFVSTEDESSDDDEKKEQMTSDSDGFEDVGRYSDASEDVTSSENLKIKKKRKRIVDSDAPEEPEVSEDVEKNSEDPEDVRSPSEVLEEPGDSDEPEDVPSASELRKKLKNAPDDSEDVGKKKKRRRQNSGELEDVSGPSETSKDPDDVTASNSDNTEGVGCSEATEDVKKKNKKKKRRRQDSEDVPIETETPDAPEDVEIHNSGNSEVVECSEDTEDVKKKNKKKKEDARILKTFQ